MAHTNSAKKRARQNIKRQAANRAGRSLIKTLRRDLLTAVEKKDKGAMDTSVRAYASALDKCAKRGIITKNTAVRKKTRALNLVRGTAAA
jgi:small subunit ribosomal protein S20